MIEITTIEQFNEIISNKCNDTTISNRNICTNQISSKNSSTTGIKDKWSSNTSYPICSIKTNSKGDNQ